MFIVLQLLAFVLYVQAGTSSLPEALVPIRTEEEATSCFRGYQIGHEYHYQFVTRSTNEKESLMGSLERRTDRQDLLTELDAIITPIALDKSGQLHMQLEIVGAKVRNKKGWGQYEETYEDGHYDDEFSAPGQIHDEEVDDNILHGLQQSDFYYSQACDLSITRIHYPLTEDPELIQMKQNLVHSFAQQIVYGRETYQSDAHDYIGPMTFDYEVQPAEEAASHEAHDHLTVRSSRDHRRVVDATVFAMPSRDQPEHAVTDLPRGKSPMDETVKRDSMVRGGIVHKLVSKHSSRFPPDLQFNAQVAEMEEALRKRDAGEEEFNDGDAESDLADFKWGVGTKEHLEGAEEDEDFRPGQGQQYRSFSKEPRAGQAWQSRVFADNSIHLRRIQLSRKRSAAGTDVVTSFRQHLHRKYGVDEAIDNWVSVTPFQGKGAHRSISQAKRAAAGTAHDDIDFRRGDEFSPQMNGFPTSVGQLDPVLREIESSEDPHRRNIAAMKLKHIIKHDRSAAPLLATHLRTTNSARVQHVVLMSLGYIGGTVEQQVIMDAIESKEAVFLSDEARSASFRALAQAHKPTGDTVRRIEDMMDHEDLDVAYHATTVYGALSRNLHYYGEFMHSHKMREVILSRHAHPTLLDKTGKAVHSFALRNSLVGVDIEEILSTLRENNATTVNMNRKRSYEDEADDRWWNRYGPEDEEEMDRGYDEQGNLQPAFTESERKRFKIPVGEGEFFLPYCGSFGDPSPVPGVKCGDLSFAKKRPADPEWMFNKKLGPDVIYGELTLIFHLKFDLRSLLNFKFDFFVGGELAAFFIVFRFELAAAYVKIFMLLNATRTSCSAGMEAGMYMAFFQFVYWWGFQMAASAPQTYTPPGRDGTPSNFQCRRVKSTCVAHRIRVPTSVQQVVDNIDKLVDDITPGDAPAPGEPAPPPEPSPLDETTSGADADVAKDGGKKLGALFDGVTIFTTDMPPDGGIIIFSGGFFNIVLLMEAGAQVGINFGFEIIFAPERENDETGLSMGGGMAIVGEAVPELIVSAVAEIALSFWIIKCGIGIYVIVLRIGLPNVLQLNSLTERLCTWGGLEIGSLGGRVYLFIKIGWKWFSVKFKVTLFKWKGLSWELDLHNNTCCTFCTEPCMSQNAWCDFKIGECICNEGWGGIACDIQCPRRIKPDGTGIDHCFNISEVNPGVKCTPNPEHPHTDDCECYYGYLGWNCLDECPGLLAPEHPCLDNGYCNLQGTCDCDENYFGWQCDKTCEPTCPDGTDDCGQVCFNTGDPADPVRARCAYVGGFNATCHCFRGFAGPECKAECKLLRGAPCAFHGDCIPDENEPADSFENAQCHCHMGYSGEDCGTLDYGGGGRSLRVDLEGNVTFARANAAIFARGGPETFTSGLWFRPDALPAAGSAILMQWQMASIRLYPDGSVACCAGTVGLENCGLVSTKKAVANQWQWVLCATSTYPQSYDTQMWHYAGASARSDTAPCTGNSNCFHGEAHYNDEYIRPPGALIAGAGAFAGSLENVFVFNMVPPSDDYVLDWKLDAMAPDEEMLAFYAKLDLGSGIVLYDEANLVGGRSSRNHSFWEVSTVPLRYGAIYSNASERAVPVDQLGIEDMVVWYDMDFKGRRFADAFFSFYHDVSNEDYCMIDLTLNGVSIHQQEYTGVGDVRVELSGAAIKDTIKGGTNELLIKKDPDCPFQIDRADLVARVPASDTVMETAFDKMRQYVEIGCTTPNCANPVHKAISGSYTMEVWIHRPPILHSWNGMVMHVSGKSFSIDERPWGEDYFRWYEDGRALGPNKRGVQATYSGGGSIDMHQYSTPRGRWFHYALVHSGGCAHTIYIDGKSHATQTGSGSCNSLLGFGDSNYRVKLLSDFMGQINDFIIWPEAKNEAFFAKTIFQRPVFAGALYAYDFEDGHQSNGLTVSDKAASPADGIMNDGIFRGLLLGAQHDWGNCPGASYYYPESPCGAHPLYSRGTCTKPGRTDGLSRICDCLEGFAGSTCLQECPGAPEGRVCNTHGTCFFENGTYCQCDEGYVGEFCEHLCPGYLDSWNVPRRVCAGFGECNMTEDKTGAQCVCYQDSDRYGDACQYAYGTDPEEGASDPCAGCTGDTEWCVDAFCTCRPGYYRVFDECLQPAQVKNAAKDNDGEDTKTIAGLLGFAAFVLLAFAGFYLYATSQIKREQKKTKQQMMMVAIASQQQ
jgi:hypothetical protein